MDAPRYTVAINSFRGWSMTAVHGQHPDTDDLAVRRILVDPFRVKWAFVDEQLPNPVQPTRVTFTIWSRTAADDPLVDIGDYFSASARVGLAGAYFVRQPLLRVTEVSSQLEPGDPWAVRTTITALDVLTDQAGKFPQLPGGRKYGAGGLRRRWARLGAALGYSVGCPTTWDSYVTPTLRPEWSGPAADELAAQQLASFVPDGIHHAVVPYYTGSPNYPAGYRYVDESGTILDPTSTIKYLVAPASRRQSVTFLRPLLFEVVAGVLTLISRPTDGPRMPAVSARYCDVPSELARTREHIINTVRLAGFNLNLAGNAAQNIPLGEDSSYELSSPDAANRGTIGRDITTQLMLRSYNNDPAAVSAITTDAAAIALSYLSDDSTLASTLAFKSFRISAHEIPQTAAEALLPHLMPSYPGDGGDGRIVRHLTVYTLPANAQLPGAQAGGFIVAGDLTIESGELLFDLIASPGRPIYPTTQGDPITVGEFVASSYSSTLAANLDPFITAADLDLVD